MQNSSVTPPLPAAADTPAAVAPAAARPLRPAAMVGALVLAAFAWPLWQLTEFALRGGLHSHIVLIPAVSLYFIWIRRDELPRPTRADWPIAFAAAAVAAGLLLAYFTVTAAGTELATNDRLFFLAGAFVATTVAVAAWSLGRPLLRSIAFPLGFLVFMIPLPTPLINLTEYLLQHGSAFVAFWMITLIGTPVFKDGLIFILPGFSMEVAPQCSGINSSYALLITSVAAGYLFLRSPWKRVALVLFVAPLALLRNGLRVTVIGELCVRVGPEMIHSWVHKNGGPFFFALSLIPFSIVLLLLYRSDQSKPRSCAA